MPDIPNEQYFQNIRKLRPYMEDYNQRLINAFNDFLHDPSPDMLMPVLRLSESDIAKASANNYRNINIIHEIVGITSSEISIGLVPITEGAFSHSQAIDKYYKIIFMLRRPEIMTRFEDSMMIAEAVNYIITSRISPIAIAHILDIELLGNPDAMYRYWEQIFSESGLNTFALLLSRIHSEL